MYHVHNMYMYMYVCMCTPWYVLYVYVYYSTCMNMYEKYMYVMYTYAYICMYVCIVQYVQYQVHVPKNTDVAMWPQIKIFKATLVFF